MFAGMLFILTFYIFSFTGPFDFGADPEERYALLLVFLFYLVAMCGIFLA